MNKLIVIFIFWIPFAHAELFQAALTDTEWQVTKSPLACTLTQAIPGFGDAQFSQAAGGKFTLSFTTTSYPAKPAPIHFEIAAAPWQNINERLALISMIAEHGQSQFTLTGSLAKQAFTATEKGQFPAVRYQSHAAPEAISALLSSVHFRDSSRSFAQCLEQLFPYSFEQLRQLTIHFRIEDSALSDPAKAALTTLAEYIKLDNSIKRIRITGHTDNHGRKAINIPLSEARAISVKNFLVKELAIPEKLIITSFHREFIAAASNKTEAGRIRNRRAEIELIR